MNCQYMKDKISELVTDRKDEILDNCIERSVISVINFYGNGNVLVGVRVCVWSREGGSVS